MVPAAYVLLLGAGVGFGWLMKTMHMDERPEWLGHHAEDKPKDGDVNEDGLTWSSFKNKWVDYRKS